MGELGADVVIPDGANATQSIQKLRDVFGGGVDTAIHVAGDRSVVASVVWPGGRFTSVTDVSISATRGAGYVPTIVAPNGHKLASPMRSIRVVTTPRAASSSHAEQLSRTG